MHPGAARDGVAAHYEVLGSLAHREWAGRVQAQALLRIPHWCFGFVQI